MDVRQCRMGTGLELAVTGSRAGVVWKPRHGSAVGDSVLSGIDWGFAKEMTFPEVSGSVTLDLTGGGTTEPAQDTLVISGVTGTGAGSLNVTYTRAAELSNGMPRWVNGTAEIAWDAGWKISLGGVTQFTNLDLRAAMPWEVTVPWEIAGAATGDPEVATQDDGTVATVSPSDGVDFEGVTLAAGTLKRLELVCDAGAVVVQWRCGMQVLEAGGDLALDLRAAAALAALGTQLKLYGLTAAAAASVTVVGVATA